MKDPRRVASGRIGALKLHGTYDSRAIASVARDGILAKFRAEAAAVASARGEEVSPEELDRRARYLRRSHMALMAYERERDRRKARAEKSTAIVSTSTAVEEVYAGAESTDLPTAV